MGKTIYRHYGNSHMHKICPPGSEYNYFRNKMSGGLWASRKTNLPEKYISWNQWCKENLKYTDMNNYLHFDFKLRNRAKILLIDSPDVFIENPNITIPNNDMNCSIFSKRLLNIKYILKNYDGIELIHGDYYSLFHDIMFYDHRDIYSDYQGMFRAWDCDSICIWNDRVVKVI